MKNSEKVFKIINSIPQKMVLTYKGVDLMVGINNPTVVGNIVHRNHDLEDIPFHRVVNAKGLVAENFAFGGSRGQIIKLKLDGIEVINNRVSLNNYPWNK